MHGFLGFNHIGPLQYFTLVRESMELEGFHAYAPTVDPLGTYERRAYEWFYGSQPRGEGALEIAAADPILDRPSATYRLLSPRYRPHLGSIYLAHRRPMHLVTHSQAALDARFLVSPDGMGHWRPFDDPTFPPELRGVRIVDTVASVTTIAGPHDGVFYADDEEVSIWLLREIMRPEFDRLVSSFSHDRSDIVAAIGEMGRRHMLGDFNPRYGDAPIPYYSVAGVTNEYQVTFFLRAFYEQLRHNPSFEAEPNDGLVPISSAKWPHRSREDADAERRAPEEPLDERHPPEQRGRWRFLGLLYADHVHQIGLPFAIPRNHLFHPRRFYDGLGRFLLDELGEGAHPRPNGSWTD